MTRNGKIITTLVMLVVVFVTVGFGAFSNDLSITEIAATVRPVIDTRITNFHVSSTTGGASSSYDDYNAANVMTDISLPEGATITYTVEIKNYSNASAVLQDITGLPSNLKYEIDVGETNRYELGDTICNNNGCGKGTNKVITLTISYDTNGYDPTDIDYSLNINFEFLQLFTVTYTNIVGDYPTSILDGNVLTVDFSGTLYGILKIYQDGKELSALTDYIYNEMVLTIPDVEGNIEIVNTGNICLANGITNLGNCLLAIDQYTTNIDIAKTGIANKGTPNFNLTEPQLSYEQSITYGVTSTNIKSTTSDAVRFTTTVPTFNSETGIYKLSNTVSGKLSDYISDGDTKYYTCMDNSTSCATVYVVYNYRTSTNSTSGTITYYATKADRYTYKVTGTSVSNPGLYKDVDDYGDTYYYRGQVVGNWVKFGDFLWRIVRINGDGSVRLIYSGLASSSKHTGSNAQIVTTTYGDTTTTFTATTTDVTGLTNDTIKTSYRNGTYGTTYVGYMYNPEKEINVYPNRKVGSSNTQSGGYKLNYFPTFINITSTANYYFFKDFNPETDCFTGNADDDSGACTLKCKKLGDDGDNGVDCVRSSWNTLATKTGNYDVNGAGAYTSGSTEYYPYKTDGYKYTCWGYGTAVTRDNSDDTTSVYITCPIVSEIVGVVSNSSKSAKVKYHGLFSKITDQNNKASESNKNISNSNIKNIIDSWYVSNILGKYDSNKQDANLLEDYLQDEIFCNDRTSSLDNFPLTSTGTSYAFSPQRRIVTNKKPSFKCLNNNNKNDAFTLKPSNNVSTVEASGDGNEALDYPVGLITIDEAFYAGAKYNTKNSYYYLYTGSSYWTASPYIFYSDNAYAYMMIINSTGSLYYNYVGASYGVRPVINLKSTTLISGGIGTESYPFEVSPYIVEP